MNDDKEVFLTDEISDPVERARFMDGIVDIFNLPARNKVQPDCTVDSGKHEQELRRVR